MIVLGDFFSGGDGNIIEKSYGDQLSTVWADLLDIEQTSETMDEEWEDWDED